jgi:hypothetical protein
MSDTKPALECFLKSCHELVQRFSIPDNLRRVVPARLAVNV